MSAQENKEKARHFMEEAFGQGKTEVLDEVLHSDFVCYDPNSETGEVRGAQTMKDEIEYFRSAVSDLSYTVGDLANNLATPARSRAWQNVLTGLSR
jgi:hypothetical protein